MTIREYAKQNGHEIDGKLTRRHDIEEYSQYAGKNMRYRLYTDEIGNEYLVSDGNCVCICTYNGGVI